MTRANVETKVNTPVVDQVILTCQGCKVERLFYPNPPLVGAAAIKKWLDTKPTPCPCGAPRCDAKMRLKQDPEPEAPKLKRNAVRCKLCNDVIESKHRHDFRTCSCGNVSVDGGLDYTRRAFRTDDWEELAESVDEAAEKR